MKNSTRARTWSRSPVARPRAEVLRTPVARWSTPAAADDAASHTWRWNGDCPSTDRAPAVERYPTVIKPLSLAFALALLFVGSFAIADHHHHHRHKHHHKHKDKAGKVID